MYVENVIKVVLLSLMICFSYIQAWSDDELEVFDAVEEIKQNFYDLLKVPQNADLNLIKKSFRQLSLVLHPDKNPSPNADEEFRHLMLSYEILRHTEKRKYYDNILINGLPDWKQAVYYYRRVRKIGLSEMIIILTVILSIGQYLVAWASYFEKKYTLQGMIKTKDKKFHKKLKKFKNDVICADEYIEKAVQKPSILNTLPFQICYMVKKWFIFSCKLLFSKMKQILNEVTDNVNLKESRVKPNIVMKPNVEKLQKIELVPEIISDPPATIKSSSIQNSVCENVPIISGGLWTDDDILTLIKLVKKYPAGEPDRWEKIASTMRRTVSEVTYMTNKIKENDFRIPTDENIVIEEPDTKKVKTKGGKLGKIDSDKDNQNSIWTQTQQKALETALQKYSKKSVTDRWDKIASCVPDKTKDECILRYKKIVAAIKEQKLAEENEFEA